MQPLFFYGTLCHLPLLEVVLGRALRPDEAVPGTVRDHAVFWAKDQAFPIIQSAPGQQAQGLLLQGLSDGDVSRLDFYEGGFGYTLAPAPVHSDQGSTTALVYFPDPGLWTPGAPWSLVDWVAQWGDMTTRAAQEFMRHHGHLGPEAARALYPFMTARAWAQQMAQQAAPTTRRHHAQAGDVDLTLRPGGYAKFFGLQPFDIRFRRFDGDQSAPVEREAFVAFDAALVLPYDPRTDRVLLIEQLRFGPLLRTDPQPWVFEPVAGLVDAGEDPEACVRREAMEEADLTLQRVEKMVSVYASPGYSSEFFHCFLGIADLTGRDGHVAGLVSEDENIRSHVLSLDAALSLVDSGEINAGPLAMMLFWLARHRERLRPTA